MVAEPKQNDYKYVELNELVASADVIFPTMALNDQTKTILSDELLSKMKSDAMLISIVHDMFNLQLVLDMVKDNKLFGFGFEAEPASFSNYEGNVWAAPAFGWATKGSFDNSIRLWINNMVDASKGQYPNRVN